MNDPQIIGALKEVLDPEAGINIVDFGLVHRAAWTTDGIEVTLAIATTCPMMGHLIEQARAVLRRHFPDTPGIRVELDMEKPWCAEHMTDEGRLALGWTTLPDETRKPAAPRRRNFAPRKPKVIMPKVSTRWKQ